MGTILSYIYEDWQGYLAGILPEATIATQDEPPETLPSLAVIQLVGDTLDDFSSRRLQLAKHFIKRKCAVAILHAEEKHLDFLKPLAPIAARNKTPLILLNSFRFIPAVAALKEIAISGVLGSNLNAAYSLNYKGNELDSLRIIDAAKWIAGNAEHSNDKSDFDAAITVSGELGTAMASFSIDGQNAKLNVTTQYHKRHRVLPKANPLVSEMAVLAACVANETKKIKSLPLLMDITNSVF